MAIHVSQDGRMWRGLRNGRPRELRSDIAVGRWSGVDVRAHWSVFVTVGLFAVVLATGALPDARPGEPATAYWAVATGAAAVFFLTLAGQGLVRARCARSVGTPVERITLWMLGSVTDPARPGRSARADILVALAGPAASLALGGIVFALAAAVGTGSLLGAALVWLASASVVLAVLNLLPGAPLDGGRVLRAAMRAQGKNHDRATAITARAGQVLGFALIVLGLVIAVTDVAAGLWLAVAGWFIVSGADAERVTDGEAHLSGLKAADVMTPSPLIAPAWWTVQQCVAHLTPGQDVTGPVPVVGLDGHVCDVVTRAELEADPDTFRADARLAPAAAARRVPPVIVSPDTDALEVAASIRRHGAVAVVEHAQGPVGIITPLELARSVQLSLVGWRVVSRRN